MGTVQSLSMPEGYHLVDEYGTGSRFYVTKLANSRCDALQNSAGKIKLFHSKEKAIVYANNHAYLSLKYSEIVPGKKAGQR